MNYGTPARPRVVPLHQPVPASPAVATAYQLQAHLLAAYRIVAGIRTNRGTAMLTIGRSLQVWCIGERIMWGEVRMSAGLIAQAAHDIATRFHEIQRGG